MQILDCYERVRGADGRTRVHLTQLYGDVILYSTKTDPLLRDSGPVSYTHLDVYKRQ